METIGHEENSPKAYRANIKKRNTIAASKLLLQESDSPILSKRSKIQSISERSEGHPSGTQSAAGEEQDTVAAQTEEEEGELFSSFQFRSFKQHKLIEEDY